MKLLHTLVMLFFICNTATSQNALWEYLNGNAYYRGGNVGIGVILQPTERLEVDGNIKANSFYTQGIVVGSQTPELAYQNAGSTIGAYRAEQSLYLQSPNALFFHASAMEDSLASMTILPTGKIGIGTEEPTHALTINSDSMTLRLIGNKGDYGYGAKLNFGDEDYVYLEEDEDDNLVINSRVRTAFMGGRIGVRTLNPTQELDVFGDIALSDGTGRIEFKEESSVKSYINWSGTDLTIQNDESGTGADIRLNTNGDVVLNAEDDVRIDANATFDVISDNVRIATTSDGSGYLQTYGANGNANFRVSTLSGGNKGFLGVYEDTGDLRVRASILSNGAGNFATWGTNGKTNFYSGGTDSGFAYIYNSGGSARAGMDILATGAGYFETTGSNGQDNVRLTTLSGSSTRGFVALVDEGGTTEAGIYVNSSGNGQMFADIKNFRMEHPTKKGKDIWYACIEGPEAAAYERGVGTLKNGEAFIQFSEHFELVVNVETMTVILTPHSTETYGLAIVDKTAKGILVRELNPSKKRKKGGNFKFDWEAKGVRKGYEDYRVIRDSNEDLPTDNDAPVAPEQLEHEEFNNLQDDTIVDATMDSSEEKLESSSSLGQNRPNPFDGTTTIPFHIDESVQNAEIFIYGVGGNLEKQFRISDRGTGEVTIDMNVSSEGNYFYALVLDGKLIETKQMMLAKQ